jgi:hypothetical protein
LDVRKGVGTLVAIGDILINDPYGSVGLGRNGVVCEPAAVNRRICARSPIKEITANATTQTVVTITAKYRVAARLAAKEIVPIEPKD